MVQVCVYVCVLSRLGGGCDLKKKKKTDQEKDLYVVIGLVSWKYKKRCSRLYSCSRSCTRPFGCLGRFLGR